MVMIWHYWLSRLHIFCHVNRYCNSYLPLAKPPHPLLWVAVALRSHAVMWSHVIMWSQVPNKRHTSSCLCTSLWKLWQFLLQTLLELPASSNQPRKQLHLYHDHCNIIKTWPHNTCKSNSDRTDLFDVGVTNTKTASSTLIHQQ
mgnify:CR=1 FL=1